MEYYEQENKLHCYIKSIISNPSISEREKLVILLSHIEPLIYNTLNYTKQPYSKVKQIVKRMSIDENEGMSSESVGKLYVMGITYVVFANTDAYTKEIDKRIPFRNNILHNGIVEYGTDTLYVQSDTVSVNQATEAIWQTVPLVILGIFFMSILFSVIYSRYITKPIIELSSTSQKMAQLNFEPHGNSNRSDEIGILSDSLNTLSDNLQHTLAELKKSNSELEAEISKERELEKKQQEFFSAASHELKTPLTILKGHLMGMLNKVKGYENQESYMERSLAVVEKMETLVKELLYVSKTDGKQRTEYKTIDFAELLRVQIADVTDLLSEKEISLSVDIPDKILCDADPAQMERAIQNVLVNAIRYSPNGEAIYISLSNDKNTVSCKVENTGVHIPEEMIPHLFEAFYRADTSRNRNTGGTGLGLYIVRKIMELHHAKYGIQNTSRGVVFWLEMPQERGAINSI